MATRRDSKSPTSAQPLADPPPYYIAEQPLFIGGHFGRAFNPGDQVPVDHVATYGWQDKVRLPDGYTPDQPPSEPETPDSGQAPTSEGKDA